MRHGSLFSGIGGFDLASEWMGWENVFHCEWMEFPRKVLKYYWPNSISYENICTTDFTAHRGDIDIITGGFPCQPYSAAGKRLGKEDERHLWPEMLRAIREIEPSWVVGENVRGLTNWNGGVVFEEVCADLENLGYEVQPILLSAAGVGAPHRRDRIWFVAYSESNSRRSANSYKQTKRQHIFSGITRFSEEWDATDSDKQRNTSRRESKETEAKWCRNNGKQKEWSEQTERIDGLDGFQRDATDSDSNGQQQCDSQHEVNASEGRLDAFGDIDKSNGNGDATDSDNWSKSQNKIQARWTKLKMQTWHNFPTQSPICNGDDGLSSRLDSITFPKWRNESIKGGGNAIVPQVAYQIFKVIEQLKQKQ